MYTLNRCNFGKYLSVYEDWIEILIVIGLQDITLAPGEMRFTIDLRPYMNSSPYTVQHVSFHSPDFVHCV